MNAAVCTEASRLRYSLSFRDTSSGQAACLDLLSWGGHCWSRYSLVTWAVPQGHVLIVPVRSVMSRRGRNDADVDDIVMMRMLVRKKRKRRAGSLNYISLTTPVSS